MRPEPLTNRSLALGLLAAAAAFLVVGGLRRHQVVQYVRGKRVDRVVRQEGRRVLRPLPRYLEKISEWQLVLFTGNSDPGRLRSAGWNTVQTVPYTPGGMSVEFTIPCLDPVLDDWLAIGIGFNGGAYGVIDSALVGPAIEAECQNILADPQFEFEEVEPRPRPSELYGTPGRTGERR